MTETSPSPAAASSRRLETPGRDTLLGHYAATEKICVVVLAIEVLVGLAVLAWILALAPRPFGSLPWIGAVIGSIGLFRGIMDHVFLSKKRLDEIRPDARFGVHTRDSLLRLADAVFARLDLPRQAAPVYLTRAKDVNAQAVRFELWPGLHVFNGVFLNRSILHLLGPGELASVIGHELGHVFPYAPLLSRCYLIHACFAGILSFAIVAVFKFPTVALLAPLAVFWLLNWVLVFPHWRLSRAIEFLCDDFGARASGLLAAVKSQLKIAVEGETRQTLMLHMLETRRGGVDWSLSDMVEAYEKAIPFGKADPKEFQDEVQKLATQEREDSRGISLGGFLGFLQGGDSDAAQEHEQEIFDKLKELQDRSVIPLDRMALLREAPPWTLETVQHVAQTIEQSSDQLLVRLEDECHDQHSTHPSTSRRILYLWRNRAAYPLVGVRTQ